MIIAKRLKGKAIATWLGPTGDAARRAVAKVRQKITSTPTKLTFYYDVSDPWSFLAAQVVERLAKAYPVDIEIIVVTPPASDVDPAPTMRPKHAVRDCQQLAAYWDLEFPGKKEADSGTVRDVGSALIKKRPPAEQLQAILELGAALWANDKKKIITLLGTWGSESHGEILPILNTAYSELRKAGHYQGAMIHYGGEWYGAIDRLPFLEAALAKDFGRDVAHVVATRPQAERGAERLSEKPLVCDLWFSFRSPFSYLALEQIESVLAPYEIPLVLRQVAPMVTRGLAVPGVKRMYLVRDAKREADRLGISFGQLCDPLGKGVDNCLAVMHWANARGAGLAFAKSAMRGIWSEARDVGEYVDLRFIVERAGLPWDEARAAIGAPEATKAASVNAADLAVIGLWGVPSFRVGDFVAWGQDRLPLLADRLRRHALAVSAA
ncbi:MAG: DsbA family protein [Deltaproteobacteria bacterium]|nr:DsbA family protein [Deltaproteobacteria bacterium]MDQ3296921.1 DsbA family protein [Myxococcota bacterium]